MLRAGGQIRAIPGAVLGFDMTAVLAMARATGISEALVCDFLPAIEAALVAGANQKTENDLTFGENERGGKAGIGPAEG